MIDRKRLRFGQYQYGGWLFDLDRVSLSHVGEPEYEIDLRRCGTLGDLTDWMMHLHDKAWMTSALLGDLTAAFCDLLGPVMRHGTPIGIREMSVHLRSLCEN